jgi:spermidine/putrescine transport system permease protein
MAIGVEKVRMSASPSSRGSSAPSAALVGIVFLYLYLPILILVAFSFNDSRQLAVWQGFTLDWYVKAWQDEAVIQSLRTSLFVGVLCTVISLAIGTPAAIALGRHRFRGRGLVDTLFYLPVVVPEIVLGFASVVFFGIVGWQLGFASVLVSHVAFATSYVVFVVRARLALLDPQLEEAAADLGASNTTTFLKVTLPLLAPGLVSAGLLVFTISLDDYVVTSFVAGRGGTTLPLQIYSMVRTGVTPEINAVSTILLAATIVLVALSQRLQTRTPTRFTLAVVVVVIGSLVAFAVGGPIRDAGKPELSVYIWADYLPEGLVREFEERYGVRVQLEYYDSNEALLAKLQTGVSDYDIVVPSDYMVGILAGAGHLERIDTARLSNFDNVPSRFVGLPYDPENAYSIPFGWGTTGIGYRRDLVGHDITSWNDLWDRKLRDRVGMLNDVRETFAAALKAQGASLNSLDPATIDEAARRLERQKDLVRTYDSDTFDDSLLAGEVWAAQGYNGQVAKAARENPDIVYVIPVEGCTLFIDNLCIPKGAPNKDLALLFMNFMLEGKVAASVTELTGYATANSAAVEFLPPELRGDKSVFPDDTDLDRCELLRDVGEAIELYDRHWTRIKS